MTVSFYQSLSVLGLKPGYTALELKRAWRKSAHRHHPDKGGDAEKFKAAAAAYKFLSTYAGRGDGMKIFMYSTHGGFSIKL